MKKKEKSFYIKYNMKWVINISILTFILAILFSLIAENIVVDLGVFMALVTLLLIVAIGILFDTIGIAVTTAEERPFHAMAANRVEEARMAIKLVRNASQVSNFCNDVIGDICGIISGAVGTTLVFKLITNYSLKESTIYTIIGTAIIAALTVGGKAIGKSVAMLHYEKIIFQISKILTFFEKNLGLDLFPIKKKDNNKNNKSNR